MTLGCFVLTLSIGTLLVRSGHEPPAPMAGIVVNAAPVVPQEASVEVPSVVEQLDQLGAQQPTVGPRVASASKRHVDAGQDALVVVETPVVVDAGQPAVWATSVTPQDPWGH